MKHYSLYTYRVTGDWMGPYSRYEWALRRARELRTRLNGTFDVIEIDEDGNETPVAHVAPKRAPVVTNEPRSEYAR